MGSGVPLLNDYKLEFFWKRFPQTIIGGAKLRLGYDAPTYVYLNQILLLLFPWLLGGICTILVELLKIDDEIGVYIFGGLMILYTLAINIISAYIQSRGSSRKSVQGNIQNVLSEDDEIEFTSCCGFETIAFIVPGKKYRLNILLHALIAGGVGGLGFWYLLPQTLNNVYSNNVAATVLLYMFGWVALLVGLYSLTVGPPPEPATYGTTDELEMSHLTRPFYMMVFFSFDLIAR